MLFINNGLHYTIMGIVVNVFNLALNDLQDKVLSMGGRELSEYGLPQPQTLTMTDLQGCSVPQRNKGEQQAYVECNLPLLATDQQKVYDCFCSLINSDEGGMLFQEEQVRSFQLTLF